LNRKFIFLTIFVLSISAGCENKTSVKTPDKEKIFLKINFHKDEILRYNLITERQITVDWNPSKAASETNDSVQNKSIEKLNLIMTYTPIETDSSGTTTIKAECQSAEVTRNEAGPKDAAEYFMGKTFTFTIDSTGKIQDYSQLDNLIKEIGQKAFSSGTGKNRIKNPDMIGDVVATQWFLWDSIASIPNSSQGINAKQSWTSKLSVPTPMVSRLARDVSYTLEEIKTDTNASIAVIKETYTKSGSVPQSWPIPYTGSFQMKGTFGLLGSYKLLDLTGHGLELFNINSGQMENYDQQYDLAIQASVPMGLNVKPIIIIKQKISMKRIKE
jgi:hypothetical protein